jgi:hypothetical protein
MSLPVILILALIVILVAYALGTYLRQKGELPGLPKSLRPPKLPRLKSQSPEEHETQVVINWLLSQAFEQTGVRVADDRIAYERIVEAAHKAVQSLKTQKAVTISLPFLTADASGPKHFEIQLTREVIRELARY